MAGWPLVVMMCAYLQKDLQYLGVRVTGDIGGLDVLHYGQGLQTL